MLPNADCVKWLFTGHRLNPQMPPMSVYEYALRYGSSEWLVTKEQQPQFLNNNILILETRLNQLHLNSDTQLIRKRLLTEHKTEACTTRVQHRSCKDLLPKSQTAYRQMTGRFVYIILMSYFTLVLFLKTLLEFRHTSRSSRTMMQSMMQLADVCFS